MTDAEPIDVPEHRMAWAAMRRAGRGDPILISLFGPGGTGKSTLISKLGMRLARGHRSWRVLPSHEYSPEDFADLVAVDVLALDDVQQLPPFAVDSLARLLDARTRLRRATVLTMNAPPARLVKLTRRVLDRIAAGLVLPVAPPGVESRAAILLVHLVRLPLAMEPAAVEWLARRSGASLRPLLGTLTSLKAQHRGQATPIRLGQVRAAYAGSEPGVERIIHRVAAEFGLTPRELVGPSRLPSISRPRQVAMFLALDVASLSLPSIGEHFGGRDRSTVQHAITAIRTAAARDRQLAGTLQQLKWELC